MHRCLITLLLLVPVGLGADQTSAEIQPSELSRIPGRELGIPYWQQLAVTLGHDDVPGDSTIVVVMPKGVVAWDGNKGFPMPSGTRLPLLLLLGNASCLSPARV